MAYWLGIAVKLALSAVRMVICHEGYLGLGLGSFTMSKIGMGSETY